MRSAALACKCRFSRGHLTQTQTRSHMRCRLLWFRASQINIGETDPAPNKHFSLESLILNIEPLFTHCDVIRRAFATPSSHDTETLEWESPCRIHLLESLNSRQNPPYCVKDNIMPIHTRDQELLRSLPALTAEAQRRQLQSKQARCHPELYNRNHVNGSGAKPKSKAKKIWGKGHDHH